MVLVVVLEPAGTKAMPTGWIVAVGVPGAVTANTADCATEPRPELSDTQIVLEVAALKAG